MTYPYPSPWTPARIEALIHFWDTDLSCSQIAERIGGVSRNAVIGKAYRLGLEEKPSPIIRYEIDAERFTRLWNGDVAITHMGFVFKCPVPYIRAYARKLGLKQREHHYQPKVRKKPLKKTMPPSVPHKPIIIGLPPECRCKGDGCLCEAVPGALLCYACGTGEVHVR